MQHILLPFVDEYITNEAAQPFHDMTTWFCRDITLKRKNLRHRATWHLGKRLTQVKTPNFSRAF